jgi:glycosyltransferase involved in cell wall biosynthesis
MPDAPRLSVVLCTYERHELLAKALAGLCGQTLEQSRFEVVLVDDGSTDATASVAEQFSRRLPLRYFFQRHAGLGSARNHGVFASRGDLLLFLDDDDVPAPSLLEEHVASHEKHDDVALAVLNRTTWAPGITVTPLMDYVTGAGGFLFSYDQLAPGGIFDFTCFWGGRVSCKRLFLLENGVFDPIFSFGCEDIELAFRLSQAGLRVLYNPRAVTQMTRPVAFDDFLGRLGRQGRSQWLFGCMHDSDVVRRYAEVDEAERRWPEIAPIYEAGLAMARRLDTLANSYQSGGFAFSARSEQMLHDAYRWAFLATRLRGIIKARDELGVVELDGSARGVKTRTSYDGLFAPAARKPAAPAPAEPPAREALAQTLSRLEGELAAARHEAAALRASLSWRITWPLRRASDALSALARMRRR